jgi:hypothetical protein
MSNLEKKFKICITKKFVSPNVHILNLKARVIVLGILKKIDQSRQPKKLTE